MNEKAVFKAVLACVGMAAIVAVAGADLFPAMSPIKVFVYAGCAVPFVLALAAVAIVAGQQWNLFGLNHGGTDPQWMWFGGEPPGLQKEQGYGTAVADARSADEARNNARASNA